MCGGNCKDKKGILMGKKIVVGLFIITSVMMIFCGCGKDSIEQQYSEILKTSDTVYSTNEFEGLKGGSGI